MLMNDTIREMIMANASTDAIRDQARRDGMITLRDFGMRLATTGITSLDEIVPRDHRRGLSHAPRAQNHTKLDPTTPQSNHTHSHLSLRESITPKTVSFRSAKANARNSPLSLRKTSTPEIVPFRSAKLAPQK